MSTVETQETCPKCGGLARETTETWRPISTLFCDDCGYLRDTVGDEVTESGGFGIYTIEQPNGVGVVGSLIEGGQAEFAQEVTDHPEGIRAAWYTQAPDFQRRHYVLGQLEGVHGLSAEGAAALRTFLTRQGETLVAATLNGNVGEVLSRRDGQPGVRVWTLWSPDGAGERLEVGRQGDVPPEAIIEHGRLFVAVPAVVTAPEQPEQPAQSAQPGQVA